VHFLVAISGGGDKGEEKRKGRREAKGKRYLERGLGRGLRCINL
jgi:hypothetical protein